MKPRFSVIVAAIEASGTVDRCLGALRSACAGVATEIVVAHPDDALLATQVRRAHRGVRLVAGPRGALVPELWAMGFRHSRGEIVAFCNAHCVVPLGWGPALLRAIESGATGAGGALELEHDTGIVDWAVYLLRYSAFMPPPPAGAVAEIPGDNAAYARGTLERHADCLAEGFWEVDLHRRIRADGGRLVFAPEATVAFGRSSPLRVILRHRYLHGRHFGAYRVTTSGLGPLRLLLAAPLVPVILATRILRRVAGRPALWSRALLALPVLLGLATAWAAGEALGAWRAARWPAPAQAA